MPIFFQQQINETTRLGIWKIEETEDFFRSNVPQHRDVTHPHKRLQHLAGRFLLQYLFPAFPYELVRIADTRKPFLKDEQYHFSISHCGDYAAAIVSKTSRVGIDIEIPVERIIKIQDKFLSEEEKQIFNVQYSMFNVQGSAPTTHDSRLTTLLWSSKEAVFKWYGDGGVDFRRDIQLRKQNEVTARIYCLFLKNNTDLTIHYRVFGHLVLAWVVS
ncbi:MAG TPA: 4'-phosphopantetheinyl transferase superfamily protein [Chitinophagaceae bacterium]